MLFLLFLFTVLFSATCYASEDPLLFPDNFMPKNSLEVEAPFGRFTYPCSVRSRIGRGHVCGAALIDEKWVVTAAHCVDPSYSCSAGDNPLLYCGIHDINSINPEETFDAEAFVHPEWSGNAEDGFDVALLRLDHKSRLTQPRLDLYSRFNLDPDFISLGWGMKLDGSSPTGLQMATHIDRIPDSVCKMLYPEVDLRSHMFCAGSSGQGSGKANEGGPLIYVDGSTRRAKYSNPERDVLVGIHSFSERTSYEVKPVIYTNLIHFLPWIEMVLLNCSEEGSCEHLLHKTPGEAEPPSMSSVPAVEVEAIASLSLAQLSEDVQGTQEAPPYIEPEEAPPYIDLEEAPPSIEPEEAPPSIEPEEAPPSIEPEEAPPSIDLEEAPPYIEPQEALEPLPEIAVAPADEDIDDLLEEFPEDLVEKALQAIQYGDCPRLKAVLEDGCDPNAVPFGFLDQGVTLLLRSVQEDHTECVQTLLEHGADPSLADKSDSSPLHYVVNTQNLDIAKLLVDAGADLDAKNDGDLSPLFAGVVNDAQVIVTFLLENGADSETTDSSGSAPLHWAASRKNYEMVKILLDGGADIETRDKFGQTPLRVAAVVDAAKIAELLLEYGADIETRNKDGNLPISGATWFANVAAIEVLAEHGADINAKGLDGQTPLHFAAKRGHLEVTQLLLELSGDKTIKDDKGNIPYDLVCTESETTCSEELEETLKKILDPKDPEIEPASITKQYDPSIFVFFK